jgi:3-hydroxyisobutyrate dehydrogenase-like beta-hydroxyacid dehydrogenase
MIRAGPARYSSGIQEDQYMDRESIGFVGVGLMGHGMAKNIVEKGYRLTVTAHRNRAPVEDLVKRGASEAASASEVAATSNIVFLCLTGSPQVEATIAEMAPSLRKGTVIVDCSTSDPVSTARIAGTLARQGVDFADAPLGRTPKEAWEGTLDTMIGAEERVFERIKPVIATWAGKIVHIGGVGDGHRMKLLNNFLSLGYAAIYSEALTLAGKVGISVERFDSVIRGGRMDCGFYQTFMGYSLEGNREAHRFTISNAYKDLKYLESMANDAGVATMLSTAAKNAFAIAMANGGSGPENYVPHLPDYIAAVNGAGKVDK